MLPYFCIAGGDDNGIFATSNAELNLLEPVTLLSETGESFAGKILFNGKHERLRPAPCLSGGNLYHIAIVCNLPDLSSGATYALYVKNQFAGSSEGYRSPEPKPEPEPEPETEPEVGSAARKKAVDDVPVRRWTVQDVYARSRFMADRALATKRKK